MPVPGCIDIARSKLHRGGERIEVRRRFNPKNLVQSLQMFSDRIAFEVDGTTNTKHMMALVAAVIFTMTVASEALAATKLQTQTKTPTTTCTLKLDGSGK